MFSTTNPNHPKKSRNHRSLKCRPLLTDFAMFLCLQWLVDQADLVNIGLQLLGYNWPLTGRAQLAKATIRRTIIVILLVLEAIWWLAMLDGIGNFTPDLWSTKVDDVATPLLANQNKLSFLTWTDKLRYQSQLTTFYSLSAKWTLIMIFWINWQRLWIHTTWASTNSFYLLSWKTSF